MLDMAWFPIQKWQDIQQGTLVLLIHNWCSVIFSIYSSINYIAQVYATLVFFHFDPYFLDEDKAEDEAGMPKAEYIEEDIKVGEEEEEEKDSQPYHLPELVVETTKGKI